MKLYFASILFFLSVRVFSQDSIRSVNSLREIVTKGNIHGGLRSMYLMDINAGALSDYYIFVAGGSLRYETARWHRISAGIGSCFTYVLSSSDLGAPDPSTGLHSRYELFLGDVQDPYNKTNIMRLDMLFLKYGFKSGNITFGKQSITTPFINQLDLLMRNTLVDGLYFNVKPNAKINLEGGYIYGISPGTTRRWFNVSESVGLYALGVNVSGISSMYTSNLHSDGIITGGLNWNLNKTFRIISWDMAALSMFNTVLIQPECMLELDEDRNILLAAQVIKQDVIGSGGNTEANKTYFDAGNRNLLLGGRLQYLSWLFNISLNYTRITASGRYQMPREWGREPTFTFLMREQIEGAGDVHAFTSKMSYTFKRARIRTDVGIGYYNMPDVLNARLSKYGMPSFAQYCALVRYGFNKKMKGLDLELVYMYKQGLGETYGLNKYVINRVDMSQFSAAVKYVF